MIPMPLLFRSARLLVFLGLMISMAGCFGRKPPPAPSPLTVTVVGEADLNGGGNAAVLRIYQLAGDANFRRSPVQSFWQNDEAALADELISGKREVLLFPGTSEVIEVALDDRAQFLGFAADLRDPDPDHWRAIYPVDEVRSQAVDIRVGERRLFVRLEPRAR